MTGRPINTPQPERSARALHAVQGMMAAFALLLGAHVCADSVFLRGGEKLIGNVISEDTAKVLFQSQSLGKLEISRDSVARIERGATPAPPAPVSTNHAPASA